MSNNPTQKLNMSTVLQFYASIVFAPKWNENRHVSCISESILHRIVLRMSVAVFIYVSKPGLKLQIFLICRHRRFRRRRFRRRLLRRRCFRRHNA